MVGHYIGQQFRMVVKWMVRLLQTGAWGLEAGLRGGSRDKVGVR